MGSKQRVCDPDIRAVGKALRRAARNARRTAAATGTPLIILENGRVVKKRVDPRTLALSDW